MLLRLGALAALLAVGAGVVTGATPARSAREGGVLRIAGAPDAIDPAITLDAVDALSATCVRLMTDPDKPLPQGTTLAPEVATSYPAVSRDGRTYTFTVRTGFRFSTGEAVTAASFARQIDRVLDPKMNSPWAQYAQDIVGAGAVVKGNATHASGVTSRGNKLVIRLTHAARDFPARTTFVGAFCAVPADLPIAPEGVEALPGAGPYTVTEFVPSQKLVLKRNPFYRGSRPHHLDEIDFVSVPDVVRAVAKGDADYAELGSPSDVSTLDPRFRPQLHSVPGIGVRYVVLNNSQRLFRSNPSLRKAVNFALERQALLQARGGPITGTLTDQYLSPGMPGFKDVHIYPLRHPDFAQARTLARGHTRSGRARIYIKDTPEDIAQAQIIQRDLARIGIAATVKRLPGPALFQQFFTPGSRWDISVLGFGPDYWDPYAILNVLFDGRLLGTPYTFDIARFDSPRFNARLASASKLTGPARYRAYGELDVDLAKDEAPMVAYESESALTFVSKRVGCIVLNPFLDLAAACLR